MSNRFLWTNFSRSSPGTGSESDPFNYSQIQNYFNPDIGYDCGIVPSDMDVILAEGIINLITEDTVFKIKRNLIGSVVVKVKDLYTNPWRIESADNANSEIYLLKNEIGYNITNLEIRDFVFCNDSNEVTTTQAPVVTTSTTLEPTTCTTMAPVYTETV